MGRYDKVRMGPGGIPEQRTSETVARLEAKDKRKSAQFLRGPIPLAWINKATALGYGTGVLGFALWFRFGFAGNPIKLKPSDLKAFNLTRHTMYRGLQALESVGLITVGRKHGCSPVVTILEVKP